MEEIHRILETLERTGERSMLATITHVEGSAYRKEGTSMLFLEDGSQVGVLSAGCLEADLAARVPNLLASGASCSVVFDMRTSDPLSWGEGPGCDGVVHVTMEPVVGKLAGHLRILKEHLDQRQEVVHIKRFDSDRSVSDYLFVAENRRMFGDWSGPLPQEVQDRAAPELVRKSGLKWLSSMQTDVYVHTYYPQPRLILFGAGPDARPLAAFAAAAGFAVVVCDWRPALCKRTYFPDAAALVVGRPEELLETIPCTAYDSAIVMTHHYQKDGQLIRLLSERPLCYLGILGSKKRAERLLHDIPHRGNIHSPVGMAIGAEGPAEIAVSILADVICTYSLTKKAGFRKS